MPLAPAPLVVVTVNITSNSTTETPAQSKESTKANSSKAATPLQEGRPLLESQVTVTVPPEKDGLASGGEPGGGISHEKDGLVGGGEPGGRAPEPGDVAPAAGEPGCQDPAANTPTAKGTEVWVTKRNKALRRGAYHKAPNCKWLTGSRQTHDLATIPKDLLHEYIQLRPCNICIGEQCPA